MLNEKKMKKPRFGVVECSVSVRKRKNPASRAYIL